MPQPIMNPSSRLVDPTSLLNENSLPGGTTTPFNRCVASPMLCCFGGDEPAKDVRETSMAPWMCSLSASSWETSGSVTEIGSVIVRSVVSAFAMTTSTVFSTSSERPSLLSRSRDVTPFCQLKRAFCGSCSTSFASAVAQVLIAPRSSRTPSVSGMLAMVTSCFGVSSQLSSSNLRAIGELRRISACAFAAASSADPTRGICSSISNST